MVLWFKAYPVFPKGEARFVGGLELLAFKRGTYWNTILITGAAIKIATSHVVRSARKKNLKIVLTKFKMLKREPGYWFFFSF